MANKRLMTKSNNVERLCTKNPKVFEWHAFQIFQLKQELLAIFWKVIN